MRIQIENYVITSDPMSVTLSEAKVSEKGKSAGKEILYTIGYYSTVTQALEGLVQQKIRASSATSIHELLEEIRAIREMIQRVMQNQ